MEQNNPTVSRLLSVCGIQYNVSSRHCKTDVRSIISSTRPNKYEHDTQRQKGEDTTTRPHTALPERLRLHQAHEQLEEVKLEAVQDNNVELVTEILGDISSLKVKDDSAAELSRILQEPHFQVSQRVWKKCAS